MAKASLKLPNGTVVTLEGMPEEVKHLLELYGGEEHRAHKRVARSRETQRLKTVAGGAKSPEDENDGKPDLNQIVTLVKDCDEAQAIERQILDRAAQVDRTLLPLFIIHEHP